MDNNYNFERSKLILPEYGRHIHRMVDYLMTIEERAVRNEQAQVVIDVMGNINPVLRDAADFKHKLWDHLFIMSDFKLDVDSPYPLPTPEMFEHKPQKIAYPQGNIRYKHYGRNVDTMLAAIKESDDEEAKTQAAGAIAKYMRAKSFEYNQEHPNNENIARDIRRMSDGQIVIDEVALNSLRNDYKQQPANIRQRKNFSQGGQNGGPQGKNGSSQGKNNSKQTGKHRAKNSR